jgi:DNA-binding transcriptional ArsR family regulator
MQVVEIGWRSPFRRCFNRELTLEGASGNFIGKGGSALDLPETRHLVAFTTVLEAGGFTRAAEALNLTQSALSHQIKTLEELLGVEVFARIGKRTILTQAGEILLKHATVVLRELADARQSSLNCVIPVGVAAH